MKLAEKTKFVEGLFSVETYENGVLIDTYTKKNTIMTNARLNMANIITNKTTLSGPINKIVLGNKGHISGDLLSPKEYLDTRTSLFAEADTSLQDITFEAPNLIKSVTTDLTSFLDGQSITVSGSDLNDGTYTVFGNSTTNLITLVESTITTNDTADEVILTNDTTASILNSDGTPDGKVFSIIFDSPNDATTLSTISQVVDTSGASVTPDNIAVDVETNGNVAKYTIFIPQNRGNNAHDVSTDVIAYTEAALYAGDNIFAMRTFPARTKEGNLEFKITWSITF